MQRFERMIGILLFLRAGGRVTARALALRFEVSERTIYRDLDLLGQLGVPVFTERGRNGGIGLMPGYFLPPVTFTGGEAMSIVAGLALLGSLDAIPFAADLDTARRKLLSALPDDLRATLSEADHIIGFETPPDDIFHPEPRPPEPTSARELNLATVVSTFAEAVFQRRMAHVRYRSPYRPASSDIDIVPLGLFWDRSRWYLVGNPPGRDRSVLRADRVQRISVGSRVERASGFDIRSMLGRAWLSTAMADWALEPELVQIRISREQHKRLQRDWYFRHARYEDQPDGRVVMSIGEFDREFVFEILRWLGADAELIAPIAWRAALRTELLQMAARYED